MSHLRSAQDLVDTFASHVREQMQVDRALVVSRRGLQAPDYEVIFAITWCQDTRRFIHSEGSGVLSGGLLGNVLYAGELRILPDCHVADNDPAFYLLSEQKTLMAFPLFENGVAAGSVILLSSSCTACSTSDICILAIMTNGLDRAIQVLRLAEEASAACKALDRELDAAANVQRWLLPATVYDTAGVSLATYYRPAKKCGGDYYDVAELGDDKLGLFIADVSGKGAPAAVLAAVVRTFVEMDKSRWLHPDRLLSGLNAHLCDLDLIVHGQFVTAFCAVLDTHSGKLTYASAGHNPPRLLSREAGQVCALDNGGALPLGIAASTCYVEQSVSLRGGDLLLLYTDGIVEAVAPDGEQFGVNRLDNTLLNAAFPSGLQEVIRGVAQAVSEFCESRQASDDQALVAVMIPTGDLQEVAQRPPSV